MGLLKQDQVSLLARGPAYKMPSLHFLDPAAGQDTAYHSEGSSGPGPGSPFARDLANKRPTTLQASYRNKDTPAALCPEHPTQRPKRLKWLIPWPHGREGEERKPLGASWDGPGRERLQQRRSSPSRGEQPPQADQGVKGFGECPAPFPGSRRMSRTLSPLRRVFRDRTRLPICQGPRQQKAYHSAGQ